jgi:hypothetical protein
VIQQKSLTLMAAKGKWWVGVIDDTDGSSGQNWKATVILTNGETREANNKPKEDLRVRP